MTDFYFPAWFYCNHCKKSEDKDDPCPQCPGLYWYYWMNLAETQRVQRAREEMKRQLIIDASQNEYLQKLQKHIRRRKEQNSAKKTKRKANRDPRRVVA